MLVVNLCGAPGAGKSTGAAYIFSKLKMAGINAELITEFAKDKTWESNHAALSNQLYMLGKQSFRITRCADQVDVIVTDSPLFLTILYNHAQPEDKRLPECFDELALWVANSFDNITYLVKRVKPYNPAGRNQTEAESDELHDRLKAMLDEYNIKYTSIVGDIEDYDKIAEDLVLKLKSKEELVRDGILVKSYPLDNRVGEERVACYNTYLFYKFNTVVDPPNQLSAEDVRLIAHERFGVDCEDFLKNPTDFTTYLNDGFSDHFSEKEQEEGLNLIGELFTIFAREVQKRSDTYLADMDDISRMINGYTQMLVYNYIDR